MVRCRTIMQVLQRGALNEPAKPKQKTIAGSDINRSKRPNGFQTVVAGLHPELEKPGFLTKGTAADPATAQCPMVGRYAPLGLQKSLKPRSTLGTLPKEKPGLLIPLALGENSRAQHRRRPAGWQRI